MLGSAGQIDGRESVSARTLPAVADKHTIQKCLDATQHPPYAHIWRPTVLIDLVRLFQNRQANMAGGEYVCVEEVAWKERHGRLQRIAFREDEVDRKGCARPVRS